MSFYVKNQKGEFIPVKLEAVVNKDTLEDKLVIVKVGTDENPADLKSLELTQESFAQADILNEVDTSIIITPYQVDMNVVDKNELENKNIYIQITSGDDIGMLEEAVRESYKKLRKKFRNLVLLPTPLRVKDYNQVKDTLKRCQIRRERRGQRIKN